ncbi:hypothetical protein A1019T_02375 [Psychrobacter pasteurii]|uniref:Uncharacterized protein n=1 Tax=Psychrobacter pasteurii TaxID=1945520 RepID=A0A1R4EIU8_9GAMM|nr:hypothetical protein A1019T_02375 [Psychrobacter pasteurii]
MTGTDEEGNPVEATLTKNEDGTWTSDNEDFVPSTTPENPNTTTIPGEAVEDGSTVTVEAKDPSGNKSGPVTAIAPGNEGEEILATTDNDVDVILEATPTTTNNTEPSKLNGGGFVLASVGLGPILGADVLADVLEKSVIIEVEQDTVREVTLHGVSGGIQLIGTMDLYAYKQNESTGEWEQQSVNENWLVAVLLGGRSKDTDFTLTQGKWMFTMASGEGIQALTGFELKFTKDVVLDYANAESIRGLVEGNMITDDDPKYGADEVPEGSRLTSVNGVEVLNNAPTTIDGKYGTLEVKADGSYKYTVHESFRGYGEKDIFTYQVTSPLGKTSESDLTFLLDLTSSELHIEIDNIVLMDAEPTITHDGKSNIKNAVGFSVLEVGFLGPILSADALSGSGAMSFNVGQNQVKELTFHGSAGGVAVGVGYDLFIYKLDPETGHYVQVHAEPKWFQAVFLGGKSDELTLQFGEGEYKALLQSQGGLGLLTGAGLYVDHEKVYDYNQPSNFNGEVSGDITAEDSTTVLKVDGQEVGSDKGTVVEGEYGKLVINSDGTYTYTVEKPVNAPADWEPPYGKLDTFTVVTQDANGKAIIEKLNIKVGVHTAGDDFNNITIVETNVESTIEFHHADKVGNYGNSVKETFEIKADQIGRDFTINVKTSSDLDWFTKKDVTVSYVLRNDTTGQEWTFTAKKGKDASLDHVVHDLPAGQYTLTISSVDGKLQQVDVVTNITHLTEYETDHIDPITGSLFENDQGGLILDTLAIGNKQVSVNDPSKGATSITIEGQYGTLVVNKDGSYTYTPKGEAYGIDKFIYETTSKVGTKEVAVLEIDVGKNVIASKYDDVAVSSSANDTFTMGEGADTLIFNNLGGTEGGNGNNGVDTWADFNATQGDKIDITGLLDGNQTASNIGNYLKYENGVLMVDRNGNSEFEDLLKVDATDLDGLLDSIEWQAAVSGKVANYSINTEDTVYLPEDTSLATSAEGIDVLSFEGADQVISLADIMQPEVIDINGTGANTLNVAVEDVDSAIYVKGGSDDTVNLEGSNWSTVEQTTLGDQVYDIWQSGNDALIQVYIDPNINII